jgi:SAM-dependent methyltransferase
LHEPVIGARERSRRPPRLQAADIEREMLDEAALVTTDPEAAPARSSLVTHRPLNLWSLYAWHGPDFIRHVHLELLGREPEQGELAKLSSALADGRLTEIEIIGQVRLSPEGRAAGRSVPTLRLRFLLARFYRLPVIGRVARIITALGRMPRLLTQMQRVEQGMHQQTTRLDRLDASAPAASAALQRLGDSVAGLGARVSAMNQRLSEMPDLRQLTVDLEARQEHDTAVADSVLSLADRLDAVEALASRLKAERAAAMDALAQAALRRLDGMEAAVQRQRMELIDQQNRLTFILEDVRKRLALPFTPPEIERLAAEADHSLDSLYVAFEDRFRGTREDIKSRQTIYVQLMQDAGAGTPGRPILDVGCGRGEWLELARERGLTARGVDLNETMVAFCQGLNLQVACGDVIDHLRTLSPASLGAITGFHIIEHLRFKAFVQLLDLSLRALASGGVIVFETPNPDNVLVGSRTFYLDPTHRNPLPKEMTMAIAEARGFVRPQARELHPLNQSFAAQDPRLSAQLDRLFFGPQDYALIAWRP